MSWSECCENVMVIYAAYKLHMKVKNYCDSDSKTMTFVSASYFDRKTIK